jgi:D-arabinose 1-dehydrogenase-like Zn-dependent alcohol dehydrogenase
MNIVRGRISSLMDEISVDEVQAGYEHLHRGEIGGRLVAPIGP